MKIHLKTFPGGIEINGVGFQKGSLKYIIREVSGQKLFSVYHLSDTGRSKPIFQNLAASDFTDSDTGQDFPDSVALETYIKTNFFFKLTGSGGGGQGDTFSAKYIANSGDEANGYIDKPELSAVSVLCYFVSQSFDEQNGLCYISNHSGSNRLNVPGIQAGNVITVIAKFI